MAATLDGIVEGSGAVFEAKFMLPWSFSEEAARREAYAPTAAQYVGHRLKDRSSVNHYRGQAMGRGGRELDLSDNLKVRTFIFASSNCSNWRNRITK